ncbi:MAG: hypothetical protein Q8L47_04910 [bacterium]|nr:hypothetical protein [bacterium]
MDTKEMTKRFDQGMKKLNDLGQFEREGERHQRPKEYYQTKMREIQKELKQITIIKNKLNRK